MFMPLFCSNKPILTISSFSIIFSIYALFYISSNILLSRYDDKKMFNPNSQDYFRTTLLGLFSPFLFYFIKVFIFNINDYYVFGNFIVDYFLSDWFILCILIALAYPQIQTNGTLLFGNYIQNDYSEVQWHIIPRQSYIFGISWALSELCITIISNLMKYQECDKVDNDGNIIEINSRSNLSSSQQNDMDRLDKNNITLSKCINVRRLSSSISTNVYYTTTDKVSNKLLDLDNDNKGNYGSIEHNNSNNKGSDSKNNQNNNKDGPKVSNYIPQKKSDIITIDPIDNSLRFSAGDSDDLHSNKNNLIPILEKSYGFTWVKYSNKDGYLSNTNDTKLFLPIESTTQTLVCFMQLSIIVIAHILQLIGGSLILSIYFIFVRGHERLFTRVTNFFGHRDIWVFILFVVLTLSSFNLLMGLFVFLCNDTDDWLDRQTIQNSEIDNVVDIEFNYYPLAFKEYHPHLKSVPSTSSLSMTASHMSSSFLTNFRSNFEQNYEDMEMHTLKRILYRLIKYWQVISRNPWFTMIFLTIWSMTLFFTGIVTTITETR